MKCQKCGTMYAKNEVKCSNCGEQLRAPDKIFRLRFWLIIGCAVFMLLLFIACLIIEPTYEWRLAFNEFCEKIGTTDDVVYELVMSFGVLHLLAFIFNMISHTKLKNGSCGFFCVVFMLIPLLGIPGAYIRVQEIFEEFNNSWYFQTMGYGANSELYGMILLGILTVLQIVIFIEGLRIQSVQLKVQAHYRENGKLKA